MVVAKTRTQRARCSAAVRDDTSSVKDTSMAARPRPCKPLPRRTTRSRLPRRLNIMARSNAPFFCLRESVNLELGPTAGLQILLGTPIKSNCYILKATRRTGSRNYWASMKPGGGGRPLVQLMQRIDDPSVRIGREWPLRLMRDRVNRRGTSDVIPRLRRQRRALTATPGRRITCPGGSSVTSTELNRMPPRSPLDHPSP